MAYEAKATLFDLLDNLPGMIYRCRHDSQRTMLFVSAGCCELTGHSAQALVDNRVIAFGQLIHVDDREAVQQEIESARRENRPYGCIYRAVTAGGQERWVWDNGRYSTVDDDSFWISEGYITDATEQTHAVKQLEQHLADRTRKLSALYDILGTASKPGRLQPILSQSLKRVLVATQGDAGFIHLREKSGEYLRLVVRKGITKNLAAKISVVSAKSGLMAWVAHNRLPLLIPKISEDSRSIYLAEASGFSFYVGVPIMRGRRIWGTLSILGKDPAQFGVDEVALLASIGEELSIVVENARLRRQAERLLVIQERNRLARELHDSVTQSLYSLTLFAEAGRRKAEASQNEEIAEYFSQIGETGQQAQKEMRLMLHKLRPPILSKEGLVRALQQRLNAVEGRAGVKHQLLVIGEKQLTPALEDTLYQIAQEALNNALKHAMATEVIVRLDSQDDQQVILSVEDNGRGFEPNSLLENGGLGLISMRERAEMFDGRITVQSIPGQGTVVQAYLTEILPSIDVRESFDEEDLP